MAKFVCSFVGNADAVKKQQRQQDKNQDSSHKAVLLTENGKGKVCVGLRQVVILADPGTQPHAEKTAGTDSGQGLHRLIPLALGICPGVKHDLDALQAVGLQKNKLH